MILLSCLKITYTLVLPKLHIRKMSVVKHRNKLPQKICERLHHWKILTKDQTNICQEVVGRVYPGFGWEVEGMICGSPFQP